MSPSVEVSRLPSLCLSSVILSVIQGALMRFPFWSSLSSSDDEVELVEMSFEFEPLNSKHFSHTIQSEKSITEYFQTTDKF